MNRKGFLALLGGLALVRAPAPAGPKMVMHVEGVDPLNPRHQRILREAAERSFRRAGAWQLAADPAMQGVRADVLAGGVWASRVRLPKGVIAWAYHEDFGCPDGAASCAFCRAS